ncbi:MAG: sodium:solute symporter family protein [Planctomycetota bacterium]|nr:sodium:solute symporter family protein [Planctomycetota bacterium]
MFENGLAWILFAIYLIGTFYLAWLGHKKTKSFADFAVGKRDMSPGIAGLTLGACLASTATFVINPGFVYQYGLSALIALTIPFFLGLFAGLAILGPGFRKYGDSALTLPLWVGQRFKSPGLRAWFACLSLLNIFYVVLVVVGSAYIMNLTMGLSYKIAVSVVVLVVFSYVFFGGTYAHAYTNTAQGAIMLVVAVIIFVYSMIDMNTTELTGLTANADPHYQSLIYPESPFYSNLFEVLLCPFIMGFAVVSQPHLLIKSLYLKNSKDMTRFLGVGGGTFVIFSLVLFAGFAARARFGGDLKQDIAATKWFAEAFPSALGSFVSVAILAAAMSTLDGLLVAVSCIVGSDLVTHPKLVSYFGWKTDEQKSKAALSAGRWTILGLGALAWGLALSPPKLVGVFGQLGVFGILAATVPTLVYGVLKKNPPKAWIMGLTSVLALTIHVALYLTVSENPTFTASVALLVTLPLPAVLNFFGKQKENSNVTGTLAREMELVRH